MNDKYLEILKDPDLYYNPASRQLIKWAEGLNDRIKAQRIVKIADKMERKWRKFNFSI